MRFRDVGLPGAWLVQAERLEDERGFFARTWCDEEYARAVAALDVGSTSTPGGAAKFAG